MLKWTSALSVGIEEIDVQHQELFRRAERLLAGLHQGEPEEIGGLIDFLHEYAVVHFGAEEAAMRAASFPGYVRHKAEHDRFIGDLLDLGDQHDRRGSGAFLSLRLSHWLTGWLKEHVSRTDTEMARFLARRSA